ncbi:MAG: endonuclease/exonuclease/phosphatase family protein [Anaerolineales bacterium]|nr:endonuclease/exonuclease/phosphatase family protein [Anaerolineales bacterium]
MTTPFSVMTWNVENLFPPGSFSGPTSQQPVTAEHFEAKLFFLSNFILGLEVKPDVIALQEIGGKDDTDLQSLIALQSRLEGEYQFSAVSKFPDSRHIKVAFLSKLPIKKIKDISKFPKGPLMKIRNLKKEPIIRMARGALKGEVQLPNGMTIRLIAVHLKSKLLTFPGGFQPKDEDERAFGAGIALMQRAAEAIAVRNFLNQRMVTEPNTHTIVLGDMNDEPLAATSQIFLGPADADVKTKDKFDGDHLYNLVDAIPLKGTATEDFLIGQDKFTRFHEGRGELIDHILVSKKLLLTGNDFNVKQVKIFTDVIKNQNTTSNPATRAGSIPPDHAPVLARFELP